MKKKSPWNKRDWNEVYCDPKQTGETLTEARELGLMFYKRKCKTHGPTPYAVLDQSCRRCGNEKAKLRNATNKEFNRPRTIFGSMQRRARLKNIECTLTLEELRGLIPKKCPVLGVDLTYSDNTNCSPSVDRFDPKKGYTLENVRIISNRANRLKSDGTPLENLQVAIWQLRHDNYTDKEIKDLI